MKKLYVLEGADGAGKSTLAYEIAQQTGGHLLHGSWNKEWNIKAYHTNMYVSAYLLLPFQDVIFDRWAVSEQVYSEAYRNGADYSADEFMKTTIDREVKVIYIYCENENAIKNHKNNSKKRSEMFADVSPVIKEYNKYLDETKLKWIYYDFDKVNMKSFVKEIVS